MENSNVNKNIVHLRGVLIKEFRYDFTIDKKHYYRGYLEIKGKSRRERKVILPVLVEEKHKKEDFLVGEMLNINGNFRTRNLRDCDKKRVDSYIFAHNIKKWSKDKYPKNSITLEGYLCSNPNRYVLFNKKQNIGFLLANNRERSCINYIPCVLKQSEGFDFKIGDYIKVKGIIISRIYKKGEEERTTYEILVSSIEKENLSKSRGLN